MSEIFGLLDNGNNFYDYLEGMINTYGLMNYHPYPAPNYDVNLSTHILTNNAWDKGFNQWVRDKITNGTVRSQITEFGWNPGQMTYCGLAQYSTWPTSSPTAHCGAIDGVTHTFDNDLNGFLITSSSRHNAEIVAAWIERGGGNSPDFDGIDGYGNVRGWFHNYQLSSP